MLNAAAIFLPMLATMTLTAIVWIFFLFRTFHSIEHCTSNIVMARFYLYVGAALALWFMLGRALIVELAVYV
jgi:hypothetical protein